MIVTTPAGERELMRSQNRGSRTYHIAGRAYPSVTTIVSQGEPKPPLVGWAKKVTAETAVNQHDLVGKLIQTDGPQAAIDHLMGAGYRKRNAAGDIGSRLHEVAEWEILNGKPFPDPGDAEARALLAQFRHFVHHAQPEWEAVEAIVYNETHLYAGTLDAIARLHIPGLPSDGLTLLDWKSGSGVYGSYALQLAAYAHAEYLIGPGGPQEMPTVRWAAVVHITTQGWRLVEMDISHEVWEAFLSCRDMAAWVEMSSGAVGKTLAHGQAAAEAFTLPPLSRAPATAAAPVEEFAARRRIKPPAL